MHPVLDVLAEDKCPYLSLDQLLRGVLEWNMKVLEIVPSTSHLRPS